MREIKVSVRERVEREHGGTTTDASARHGVHRKGSARASYAAGDPATAVDAGSTRALNSTDDDGRLHVDSTSKFMRVYDGSAWQYPIADGGIHLKKIDIGDWNMASTASLSIAHGLTVSKIVKAEVFIRGDDAISLYPLDMSTAGYVVSGKYNVYNTNVVMDRNSAGLFNSASFNDTSFNRGWIFVWYVD
jgi:hypothetical protein